MTPNVEKDQEVRLLQWLTTEVNATLDLERLYETLLRAMDELFGFRHSLILQLDEDGQALTVVASRGYDARSVGARAPVGRGPIGLAALRRRIVRLSNVGQQRRYLASIRAQMERAGRGGELESAPELPGLANAESQIAIPLLMEDTLVGVFFVETPERRVFGEREEALVGIVANHAAACIHNARLFRLEAERRDELAKLTETLEDRVRERTAELERANRELQEAHAQLVQSAKLAALGDLVAGIAHEINTPLGTIHANADLSARAVHALNQVFAPSRDDPTVARALDALEQTARTTRSATERILSVLSSLRQFARLDESERKRARLHDGIDVTLTLLRHRLSGTIEVVRDYGELPETVCFPNRLNQMFMCIVVNAIEAMPHGGTLTVRTWRDGDQAVLLFSDTGGGMPASVLPRIFDPGYTTKGVRGVGMGLGLAISYRIVQEHGGTIEVESAPGEGSRFTVRLPIATV